MANPVESLKNLPPWGKAAVAAGGLGAVYLVWRARKNAAAAPAAAPADTSNIDPQTGFATGSPADLAALGQGSSGFPVQATGSGGVPVGVTSGYGTNAAWAQAAQAGLSQVGFDPETVATALGLYLEGQAVTASQAAIVFAATAEFGAPPVSPPPVKLVPPTGPAHTGNTAPSVSGGHVVSVSNNDAVVGWTGHNAVRYSLKITGPGPVNGHTSTVTGETGSYSGLEAGHAYTVTVTPVGADGHAGHPGRIAVKTTTGGGSNTGTASSVSGGHVVRATRNDAAVAWTPHGPATRWKVTRTGPDGTHTATVSVPQAAFSGLAAGHRYSVLVQPLPSGTPGRIDFQTK